MGSVTRTKLMSIMALCAMIGLLCNAHSGCESLPLLMVALQPLTLRRRVVRQRLRRARMFITKRKVLFGAPAPKTTDGEGLSAIQF